MKSIAAYYVVLAMDSAQQDAARREAEAAPRPSRPSLFARIRSLATSPRPAQPATTSA